MFHSIDVRAKDYEWASFWIGIPVGGIPLWEVGLRWFGSGSASVGAATRMPPGLVRLRPISLPFIFYISGRPHLSGVTMAMYCATAFEPHVRPSGEIKTPPVLVYYRAYSRQCAKCVPGVSPPPPLTAVARMPTLGQALSRWRIIRFEAHAVCSGPHLTRRHAALLPC